METNQEHIQRETVEAMRRSGIPLRLHNFTLASFPNGAEVREMILHGSLIADMAEGKGLTMRTVSLDGSDIFVTTAKSLMLATQIGVTVTDPLKIIDAFEADWVQQIERVKTVSALFIQGFVEDGGTPFTRVQSYRLEKLIMDRYNMRRPTFLEMSEGKLTDWWSKKFSRAFDAINREIVV